MKLKGYIKEIETEERKIELYNLEQAHQLNENIKNYINYFGDTGISTFVKMLSTSLSKRQFDSLKDEINTTII